MPTADPESSTGSFESRERNYSDLRALFINGTLKKSPSESHTRGLMDVSRAIMDSGAQLLGMRIEEFNLEKIFKRYSREAQ